MTRPTSAQVYTFPVMNTQADTFPAASARVYTCPSRNTQAFTLPAVSTQAYTLPAVSTRAYKFPAVSTRAYTFPALSTQAPSLPVVLARPPVSTQVYTRPVVSNQPTAFPATFPYVGVSQAASPQVSLVSSSSLQVPRLSETSSRVSSFPVGPPMSSAPGNTADLTSTRVAQSHDSVVPPYLLATGLSAAVQSDNPTAVPSVSAPSYRLLPTPQPVSGNILAMIASTMKEMNADHGLPALQVVKFDGSRENYPMFRQRFHQMVESKALDQPTKMARLLQFLEGPALLAVQRYESVPGGLTKALRVLHDRFGQPFKIVRACVDTMG